MLINYVFLFNRVVGEVANTGNHFWFFNDNVSTGKFNSNLVQEVSFFPRFFNLGESKPLFIPVSLHSQIQFFCLQCPEEWLLQLALGIKVIYFFNMPYKSLMKHCLLLADAHVHLCACSCMLCSHGISTQANF